MTGKGVILLGVTGAAVLALFVGSCERASTRIHFEVPVGFRGLFVIKRDVKGVELRQSDGVVYIEIPASGIASLKKVEPLREWHTATAAYSNGETLLVEGPMADGVSLRYVETDQDGGTWFLVGTEAEEQRLHRSMERPLGSVRSAADSK